MIGQLGLRRFPADKFATKTPKRFSDRQARNVVQVVSLNDENCSISARSRCDPDITVSSLA